MITQQTTRELTLGEGNGTPLQYSCLENPKDRGVWWAIVHRVAEPDMTELTDHTRMHAIFHCLDIPQFIHSCTDGCLGSSKFWQLWIKLMWATVCRFLYGHSFHSSTLAWKIPWTEEPGRLQFMGLLIVGHDWTTSLSLFTFMHWRRKWQPTPVFLPGESQGRGSLVGCRLWGRTESDTTEVT